MSSMEGAKGWVIHPRSGIFNYPPNATIYPKITRLGAQRNIPQKIFFFGGGSHALREQ